MGRQRSIVCGVLGVDSGEAVFEGEAGSATMHELKAFLRSS